MGSSSSSRDFQRLFNGVSLIAKEILKRSELAGLSQNGDVSAIVKRALVSATDLSGLTRGSPRPFHPNTAPSSPSSSSNSNSKSKESVVVFDQANASFDDNTPPVQSDQQAITSVAAVCNGGDAAGELDRGESPVGFGGVGDLGIQDSLVPPPETQPTTVCATPMTNVDSAAKITSEVLKRRKPRERRVPSTPFSRALGFAGLGAGLAWGTVQESAKRLAFGTPSSETQQSALSPFLSERNAERLALALCRMRGAALKLGQMLSIQDESLVPAPILAALDIVRQGADVMPRSQLDEVLNAELGSDWTSKLHSFDYEPLASASIGQVHRAVTKDGLQVAMKIQYPGVADSIGSDIENVKRLLDYTNLIPEGLYLDRAMKVAKEELSWECDYELEAASQKRFCDLLSDQKGFYVPIVVDDISSKRVLTTELVSGVPIDKVASLDQETRNYVGTKLLELTLMELFVFRFMQTDPNWSNFLFDEATKSINLIDFGAARDYPKTFVNNYLRMVLACANTDRDTVIESSKKLGFLTGMESEVMLDTHVQAGFVVGLPFSKPGGYDFRAANITQSISNLGATMLRHRLTPPPDEAYSLHRKLAGAFLACIKLGAVVPCRELLLEVHQNYQFGEEEIKILSTGSAS